MTDKEVLEDALESDKMKLWHQLEKTPPEHTKDYSGRGGFRGTEYKPVHVYERLTRLFGPVGKGWGWKILSEDVQDGAGFQLPGELGSPVQYEKIHNVLVSVWITVDGEQVDLPPQYGCTAAVQWVVKDRRMKTIDDAKKMSITDAVGKGFHALGMIADILKGEHGKAPPKDTRSTGSSWVAEGTGRSSQGAARAQSDTSPHLGLSERVARCKPLDTDDGRAKAWKGVNKEFARISREGKDNPNLLKVISEPQVKRLRAIAAKIVYDNDSIKEQVFDELGLDHLADIPWPLYPAVCVLFGGDPEAGK